MAFLTKLPWSCLPVVFSQVPLQAAKPAFEEIALFLSVASETSTAVATKPMHTTVAFLKWMWGLCHQPLLKLSHVRPWWDRLPTCGRLDPTSCRAGWRCWCGYWCRSSFCPNSRKLSVGVSVPYAYTPGFNSSFRTAVCLMFCLQPRHTNYLPQTIQSKRICEDPQNSSMRLNLITHSK